MRRGTGILLGVLIAAFVISVAGILLLYALVGRPPSIEANSTLVLKAGRDLVEVNPPDVFAQFLAPERPTVRGLVDDLRKATVDRRIRSVLLKPTGLLTFWGKVQELHDAVRDFKKSGKPIVALLEYGGDRDYYLASACDKVYLVPSGLLGVNGVATYEPFFKRTLDKLGIVADLEHIGDYKTASNTFTQSGMTPADHEMTESLTQEAYDQLVKGIAEGRKKSEAAVRALIDRGPFLPEEAMRAGLVDDLLYEDQVRDRLKGNAREFTGIESDRYGKIDPTSLGLDRGPKIALIYAVGTIVSGETGYSPDAGSLLGSDTVIDWLRKVRKDDSIKAIVFRVDSPGGSAVASDLVWREAVLARNAKPFIVSMGDLGASGGYYIAMPAHAIVAQPGTLTGSIGIVTGKFVLKGLFDKLGMDIEGISRGKFADMDTPLRTFSDEERAKVRAQMASVYDDFVEKAAQGRHMKPEQIDRLGQGRVWTGRQAKQNGLVDELGGLDRAIALAKQRAKIPADSQVTLVVYPQRKGLYELITEKLGGSSQAMSTRIWEPVERLLGRANVMAWFHDGEPLALMPLVFSK